jgi:ParB-like chromosome segregation protein Spo0J
MNTPALFREIDVSRITVPPHRLRELRPETVDALAESIRRQGLVQPIRVLVKKDGGYLLIAGRHRLEAVRKLGHTTIPAGVVKGIDADQAQLAEIDENLIRADLSPAELALHTGKRKELYEKLYPDAKHGAVGRGGKRDANLASFSEATAEATGRSVRSIARDAARAKKVVVLADIKGTSLDKGEEIDALAKRSEDEQIALAARAKDGENVTARKVLTDVGFKTGMVWVRKVGELCGDLSSLEPLTTLTDKEVRKARADIKRTMERLHALDVRLAAIDDDEGTGRPTRPRAVGDSTMMCGFISAADKSLPLLSDAELKKAKSYAPLMTLPPPLGCPAIDAMDRTKAA